MLVDFGWLFCGCLLDCVCFNGGLVCTCWFGLLLVVVVDLFDIYGLLVIILFGCLICARLVVLRLSVLAC